MAGVTFNHPLVGQLQLRLPPTSIEWSYAFNTQTTQTYAGEVVQLLSMNIDSLVLVGRFGKEGAHGRNATSATQTAPRPVDQLRDFSSGSSNYRVGLTQMTEYFTRYFSIASQGRDSDASGHYNEKPMTIKYSASLDAEEGQWLAYPTSFPSYRRSNIEFAPEWRVEFQVEEPDDKLHTTAMTEELSRLRDAVGYSPNNKFSDPLGTYLPNKPLTQAAREKALKQALVQSTQQTDAIFDHFGSMIPAYTEEDLNQLIFASAPNFYQKVTAGGTNAGQ